MFYLKSPPQVRDIPGRQSCRGYRLIIFRAMSLSNMGLNRTFPYISSLPTVTSAKSSARSQIVTLRKDRFILPCIFGNDAFDLDQRFFRCLLFLRQIFQRHCLGSIGRKRIQIVNKIHFNQHLMNAHIKALLPFFGKFIGGFIMPRSLYASGKPAKGVKTIFLPERVHKKLYYYIYFLANCQLNFGKCSFPYLSTFSKLAVYPWNGCKTNGSFPMETRLLRAAIESSGDRIDIELG